MPTIETIKIVLIYLIVPLAGLWAYVRLIRRVTSEKIDRPPIIDLFLLFATYGGLLLAVLTTLWWKWSGMASLGAAYLILGAPIIMGIIAFRNYWDRQRSIYHLWTFRLGVAYLIMIPLIFLLLVTFNQ